MRRVLIEVLVVICAGSGGLACKPPALAIGTAQTNGGQVMTVAAAAFGDDFVQIMAQSADCSEFIVYRNFPSWQFDSCETCFGKPIEACAQTIFQASCRK